MMKPMALRDRLPLNSLEKFMLAHESETIAYNSQIIVEFDGTLDPLFFKQILKQAVNDIPWLRTKTTQGVFGWSRSVISADDVNLNLAIKISDHPISVSEMDNFCSQKFDLENAHTFTFLISPLPGNRHQLIFNVHHTLCDAAGQFLIMEEIFRLMNNMPVREEAKKMETFRYRHLWTLMGAKWFIGKLWENRKSLKSQRQYKMASLVDHPESSGRQVSSIAFDLSEDQRQSLRELSKSAQASLTEYIAFNAFSAYDLTLRERGDMKTPIMAYLPKTLRPLLRIRYSFQNILSTVVVVGKRDEIHQPKFLSKIKHIIQSHKMDQAAKFIFNTLLPCALIPTKKLQTFFKKIDSDPENLTCSMLISAGKVPRSYTFPLEWKNIRIWARGTMLKSPGVGIIYTGTNDCETITIEYVKGLTDLATVESLKKNLLMILSSKPEVKETTNQLKIQLIPKSQEHLAPQEAILQ